MLILHGAHAGTSYQAALRKVIDGMMEIFALERQEPAPSRLLHPAVLLGALQACGFTVSIPSGSSPDQLTACNQIMQQAAAILSGTHLVLASVSVSTNQAEKANCCI